MPGGELAFAANEGARPTRTFRHIGCSGATVGQFWFSPGRVNSVRFHCVRKPDDIFDRDLNSMLN